MALQADRLYSRRSVFISATSTGLRRWRDWLFQILVAQGIEPIEQRLLEPDREIVRKQIDDLVSAATGVICLIGPFYGYPLEPVKEDGQSRLSYTQYEWYLAQRYHKPLRTFILKDAFFSPAELAAREPDTFSDSDRFREWQHGFREMICRNQDNYPQAIVSSPEELGVSLAKIDWRQWP